MELWKATSLPYGGIAGLYPDRISNSNYAWEVNKKLEAGFEFGVFNDRLRIAAGFYRNRSSNQLVGYPLPPSTGATLVQSNLAATVQNKGFEFELNSTNLAKGGLKWESTLNLTIPRNKLLAYPGIETSAYANIYTVGKSLATPKAYHHLGVDSKTGLYTFQDRNGDRNGIGSPADLQGLYDLGRRLFGGLNNSLSFQGIRLDVFLQIVKQWGVDYRGGFSAPGTLSNQLAIVLERWQKEGDETNIQQFTALATTSAFKLYRANGDHKFTEASFVRIKNISLAYQIPASLSRKIGFKRIDIYCHGQNLFTITKYVGLDPENLSVGNLPPLRTYVFGCNLSL